MILTLESPEEAEVCEHLRSSRVQDSLLQDREPGQQTSQHKQGSKASEISSERKAPSPESRGTTQMKITVVDPKQTHRLPVSTPSRVSAAEGQIHGSGCDWLAATAPSSCSVIKTT